MKQNITPASENKEQLIHFMEAVPEGIVIFDNAGKIDFANAALEKILGFPRNEIIGCNYIDPRWTFRNPGGLAKHEDDLIFEQVRKKGEAITEEELELEVAGRKMLLSVNAAPYLDNKGNIVGVVAALTDITERNHIKEEIKEIKEVYERLTHYADEAIFRTRASDGRIIYVNEAAQKIFGYSLAEYIADPNLPTRAINPDYVQSWMNAVKEMNNGKDVIKNMLLELSAKDGRTVIMEFTAIVVRDRNGKPIYYESLGRDVTVRRFMEMELAKAQKLESIGLLAGGIAHDFNNLLTGILGCLSLAKLEIHQQHPSYCRLTKAEDHCMQAKSLTRRLLSYSRGGSPQRKTTSIAQVLNEAVNFALSGKNVKCKFELPDGLWLAQIDEGQMHQAVHYLVANATEAMPDGGIMEIGAQNVTLKPDQVPALKAGNYVKWYVKDHGIGIPKGHMKKLFDPYFTTKQMGSTKGMGLGLAICYSVIKSHDGLITVESDPGIGTTFSVYIPAINDEGTRPISAKAGQQVITKQKILLIDDERILLDVTSSMLNHLGYETAVAESHQEALGLYQKAKSEGLPFSLVIMDLTMRGDEGGEMAIRKWLSSHPEVRAIISSGYVNDPVIEEYWKYGFTGAMVKPYTLSDLQKTLEKHLQTTDNTFIKIR